MSETVATSNYIVRHGAMRAVGIFAVPAGATFQRGDDVVIRGDRGVEVGHVLCPGTPECIAKLPDPTRGEIIRRMTDEDRTKAADLKLRMERELESACQAVARRRMPMDFVDIEHLFGGERIVFYFLSEKRVDFRELVKELARESSRLGSSCGRSACATRRSSWRTTATAASPSAATRT